MNRQELAARGLLVLVVIGIPLGIFGYRAVASSDQECITVTMRTVEHGNVLPREIKVRQGERVCLRITSADVTHGFVIGDLGIEAGPIRPGEWTVVEFIAPEPGTYAYTCFIRCSPLHSKVRGELIVTR